MIRMLQLNTEHISRTLKDFYTLTKLRIVLFDADFRELLSYPPSRFAFCAAIRQDPGCNARCLESDRRYCDACAAGGEPVLYRCHAGLSEAVVPIRDGGETLGYVMFGQVLQAETVDKTRSALLRQFPEAQFPGIREKITAIPVKPRAELEAAGTILRSLTAYLMTNRWVTPEKSRFIRQLDTYIDDHISQPIPAQELCDHFGISRSRLYSLCGEYLGCTFADYVRRRRIEEAKKLLACTALPITQVASMVGFAEYNHFSRVFRAQCGCVAREYRKQAAAMK